MLSLAEVIESALNQISQADVVVSKLTISTASSVAPLKSVVTRTSSPDI